MTHPPFSQSPVAARGVVDLSTLRKPADAAPATAPAPGGAGASYVFDVSEADFQTEVLERSRTVPVVVDLWAEWCGPCKQLSPILEKLAAQDEGRWLLAKVDVDANQQLAAAFGVQSIPSVLAVIAGQLVPMFSGALPESSVRQYVDELLRLAGEHGVTGRAAVAEQAQPPEEISSDVDAGMSALAIGDTEAAEVAFGRRLTEHPGDAAATSGLAQVALLRRLQHVEPGDALRRAEVEPANVDAQLAAADVEFAEQRVDAAFARLLHMVRHYGAPERDAARERLLGMFDILGTANPTVVRARQALTSALF